MDKEVAEIVDNLTIFQIKLWNGIDCSEELKRYQEIVAKLNIDPLFVDKLKEANQNVWNLEAKIGNLALEVRRWNNIRTEVKNEIAEKYGGTKTRKVFYAK